MSVTNPLEAAQKSLCFATIDSLKRTHLFDLRAKSELAPLPKAGVSLKDIPALFNEFTQFVESRQAQAALNPRKNPFLDEALAELPEMLDEAGCEEVMKAEIVSFCNELRQEALKATEPGPLLAAEELVAKLLLILDTDEAENTFEDFTKAVSSAEKRACILANFAEKLTEEKALFDSKVATEQKIKIADGERYRAYELPKRLASLLITKNGFFNTKIRDELASVFLTNRDSATEKHIAAILKSDQIVALVNETAIPEEQNNEAWEFVFRTLDMPLDSSRNRSLAKTFHLSAQLSRLWDKDGEKFHATTTGNLIKTVHPQHFAQDLNDWLTKGYFTREINGVEEKYNFETITAADALKKEVKVREDGSIIHLDGRFRRDATSRLSDSEVLVATCEAMGFENGAIAQEVKTAISALAKAGKLKDSIVTPQKLIAQLAESFPEAERQTAIQAGQMAFISMTTNLAVSTWEQALVDMAAKRAHSLTHGKVLHAVSSTLYDHLKPVHVSEVEVSSSLQKAFLTTLNQKIAHTFERATNSFVMPTITKAEEFRQFVISALDEVKQTLVNEQNQLSLVTIVSRVTHFIESSAFMQTVLQKFDPANKAADGAFKWEEMRFLPWRAGYGDNPFALIDTYAGDKSKVTSFTGDIAEQLLMQVLTYAKVNAATINDQSTLFALARGEHAFTLDPALTKWQDPVTYLKTTAQLTFTRPLTAEERKAIARTAEEHIVDSSVVTDFQAQVDAIAPNLTLKQYRDAIATIAGGSTGAIDQKQLRMLDSSITKEAMPTDFIETIAPHIIRVATTDMFEGDKRLDLVFFPDPISRELRLGMCLQDTTSIRRLNQQEWVQNKKWDLFSTKAN